MKEVIGNIEEIRTWLIQAPAPNTFISEDQLMKFLVENIMSKSGYLLKISVALAPSEKAAAIGYTKHKAVILGHLVRLTKLYDGFCMHVAKRQTELAEVLMRAIYETSTRMLYLLKSGHQKKAIRSFILTSYRAEKRAIKVFRERQSERPLIPIEKRLLRSMMKNLREDGITFKELDSIRDWKVDGKDTAAMHHHLGNDHQYTYGFGGSSRSIHGNWVEMKYRHLIKSGAYYLPDLSFSDPDPRIVSPITIEVLNTSVEYLKWSKADSDNRVKDLIVDLIEYTFDLDAYHEANFI